jgi:hypothetical protein
MDRTIISLLAHGITRFYMLKRSRVVRANRQYIPLTPSASHVTLANESILNCLFAEQCQPVKARGKGTEKSLLLPSISKLEYLCHNQSSSCDVAFSQKRA